jgi:hypothetical protein
MVHRAVSLCIILGDLLLTVSALFIDVPRRKNPPALAGGF